MNKIRDSRAPKGFLKLNNPEVKELFYRVINSLEACQRCNVPSNVSTIGANLFNFVCDVCRKDDLEWDFSKREGGISYTIKAMVNEIPIKIDTDRQNGEGRS